MNARKKKDSEEPEQDFDARLARLGEIVTQLEEGGAGLEEALGSYREGIELLGACRKTLDGYRQEVEELTRGAEANLKAYGADPDAPDAD